MSTPALELFMNVDHLKTQLDWALWAVEDMGWSVFPCHPRSKEPATTHGVLDASNDADKIREWWAKNPN
jgi:hypothetical protein